MRIAVVASVVLACVLTVFAKEPPKDLRIGVKFRPEKCTFRTQQGDNLVM